MHPAQLPIDDLLAQCDFVRTRRQGPGGQHRNKVETAVVVRHLPTGLRGEGSERRSQRDNRRAAIARLRLHLALEIRTSFYGGVSPCWAARRQGRRIEAAVDHDDYPALLAEAFDALAAHDWNAAEAAVPLGVTTSQLVKLIGREKAALAKLNRERATRGLRALAD